MQPAADNTFADVSAKALTENPFVGDPTKALTEKGERLRRNPFVGDPTKKQLPA